MEWRRVSSVEKQARGLFTEIPFRGFTGWICIYDKDSYPDDPETEPIFQCVSRFVEYPDLNINYPIDLTVLQWYDQPDLYGSTLDNGNWVCGDLTETEEATTGFTHKDGATCTAWLPNSYGYKDYPSMYRFSPDDNY